MNFPFGGLKNHDKTSRTGSSKSIPGASQAVAIQ